MSILYLFLTWAVPGLITASLALAAHLAPAAWRKYTWLKMLVLGLGAALLGGLLGFWLLGRLFSPATALWIAVLAMCAPGLYERLRKRLARRGASQA